jgi:hypothetical protein
MSNFRFNEKSFIMKWHEEEYPEPDTIVICRVNQIEEYGVKVSILNYGGINGFLGTKELSRKKIKSIRSIMKVGDVKPLLVINKEVKKDLVYIDLSNKQVSNAEQEVERLEKYHRLTNIIHTWLKSVYNSRHIIGGKYVADLSASIQMMAEFETDTASGKLSVRPIPNIKSTESLSNVAFDEEEDIDIEDTGVSADVTGGSADVAGSDQEQQEDYQEQQEDDPEAEMKKTFPYGAEIWNKVMACTLWTYPIGDIYDIFMEIKMGKRGNGIEALASVFPELVSKVESGDLCADIDADQRIEITIEDLEVFSNLINKFINYDISLKLSLKLTSWSINSLKTITDILQKIRSIPITCYPKHDSHFTYNSIVINSPSYEFLIKSTNKALMDQIYPEGCAIDESDFGQHVIEILKEYDADIDYGIELERKDVC